MADEETAVEEQPAKSGGMLKMIIFGGIAVALLAAGIFAGPAVMNMISPDEEVEAESAEDESIAETGPAIYQSLHPPLIINFLDQSGESHYMQITLEVMSRDQEMINALREHTPVIRNALILMFSAASYESAVTRDGKQQLLDDALQEIQTVMSEQTGKSGIEAVYFTSLVIQ